jgi:arsenite-transporting ATPase
VSKTFAGILPARRVIVLLGAGGVGKTTTSIAVALAAAHQGRRVALLSIDPAKRLAAALGLTLGNQLKRIQMPAGLGSGGGSVDAAMLDHKAVFDDMVRKHAPNEQTAERILANSIYQAASTNLIGPLEYMALAKLQELSEDHRYDLVVLDTPPDTHALDFLARPNVLAGFFENKVMGWLIKPFVIAGRFGLGRLMTAGEKLMGGVAKVTGFAALHKFADFLILVQEVIEGFNRSGERVVQLLHRETTGFFLVTTPTKTSARSATNIAGELAKLGYGLDLVAVNRCLPEPVAAAVAHVATGDTLVPLDDLEALARRRAAEVAVETKLEALMQAAGAQRGGGVPRILIPELAVDDAPDGGLQAVAEIAQRLLSGA